MNEQTRKRIHFFVHVNYIQIPYCTQLIWELQRCIQSASLRPGHTRFSFVIVVISEFSCMCLNFRVAQRNTFVSSKSRPKNHTSSPEISAKFQENNNRISSKFVCILFAQYCMNVAEKSVKRNIITRH